MAKAQGSAAHSRPFNLLLAALPRHVLDRVEPKLTVVPLKLRVILHKPGSQVRDVYFPGGGFCSVLAVLDDGKMVEVATVGREGVVGMSGALNGDPSPSVTMVQAETDTCYRMSAAAFRAEMDRHDDFYTLLTRYAQSYLGFITQSAACNAVHTVEQRLARWLLLAHDRVGKDEFPMTQEFLAMMLGASRPTVTIVARTLQKAGLITYRRGRLTTVDRERLEAASCECYRNATDLLKNVRVGPQ
jgi:CRP-like cAMP-binding protein